MSGTFETLFGLESQPILGERAQRSFCLEIVINQPQEEEDRRRIIYWSAKPLDHSTTGPSYEPFQKRDSRGKKQPVLLRDFEYANLGEMFQELIHRYGLGEVRQPEDALKLNFEFSQRIWRVIENVQHRYTPPPLYNDRPPVGLG